MTLSLINSRALLGLQTPAVTVEVHLANGLPSFTLAGLADTEVKEARERVRCAIQTAGGQIWIQFNSSRQSTDSTRDSSPNLARSSARSTHATRRLNRHVFAKRSRQVGLV
jgi:Subunit ChlI of Mg-chelatase